MAYSDSTSTRRAMAIHLGVAASRGVEMDAQPGVGRDAGSGRVVFLRIAEGRKKVVYEIPLDEWSRLNRDATRTP